MKTKTDYLVFIHFPQLSLQGGATITEPLGIVRANDRFEARTIAKHHTIRERRGPFNIIPTVMCGDLDIIDLNKAGNMYRRLN